MNERQLRMAIRKELFRNDLPKLFDTKATAEILGISPGTLQNWRTVGSGPRFTNIGGAVRYQLSEINRWLEERTGGRA